MTSRRQFLGALGATLAGCGGSGGSGGSDIEVPAPDKLRTDLKIGYYLTGPRQIEETQGAINLLWTHAGFEGVAGVIEQLRSAAVDAVLDVDTCLFYRDSAGKSNQMHEDADVRLRGLFNALADAGVLHHVKVLVGVDEPNLPATSLCHHMPAVAGLLRRVAAEYAQLAGAKLGVIYFEDGANSTCGMEHFDIVGWGNYKLKSEVLTRRYDVMRPRLLPHQRFWLIPGGFREGSKTYEQDPAPFVNYAHTHDDVYAIVAFLWEARHDLTLGIRDLPIRDAYLAAGRSIVEG